MKYNKCHGNQEANVSMVISTKSMFGVLYLRSALFGVLNMQFSHLVGKDLVVKERDREQQDWKGVTDSRHSIYLSTSKLYESRNAKMSYTLNLREYVRISYMDSFVVPQLGANGIYTNRI
jgi:hypothetical protein